VKVAARLDASFEIAFERQGAGEPLLLVHGTGLSRQAWDPVVDLLSDRHELLLVDLPGHGASPPPPPEIQPTPPGYAVALAALLDELGFATVHVVGNSVGGWTAFELAKMGRARSVTALAPAGLWPKRDPLSAWAQLWGVFLATRLFRPLVPHALGTSVGRMLFMRGSIGDPLNVPSESATQLALSFQEGTGVREHLLAMQPLYGFRGGQSIEAPVTVVWGEKEHVLPKSARVYDHLPPHTREMNLPGCGHLMQWDKPELVARAIFESTTAVPARREAAT
jgi:pimeloyl-ACP methyl ester carboxylesterase